MAVDLPPDQDRPGICIPPPLLFLLPLAVAWVVERFAPTDFIHGIARWIVGLVFLLAGLVLFRSGFTSQRRAGTDPIPFHPTTRIVSHGVYRISRNPIYVGFALLAFGIAVVASSLWMVLAVLTSVILTDWLIVRREERYLERKFGHEYLVYKKRVRRWI